LWQALQKKCTKPTITALNVEKKTKRDFRQVEEQEKDYPNWDSQIS